ncbi:hypothetical protein SAMN04244574_03521, partial [Azotobacter beijerinckii]
LLILAMVGDSHLPSWRIDAGVGEEESIPLLSVFPPQRWS